MSKTLYNLIMHGDPDFWSAEKGTVSFPKERFLEHTESSLREQFNDLDVETITVLKKIPTLFATEHEKNNTRIGKITDIKVNDRNLDIQYEFNTNYLPLIKGILTKNSQELGINKDSAVEFYRTHWAIKEADIDAFYKRYSNSLIGIAQRLGASDKKVQLIYAFNGMGKTRLSRKFKELIAPKNDDGEEQEESRIKILYYNAFTEDLFYWDNDLDADFVRKLKIQPNKFTDWVLKEQGQEKNIISNFQHYTRNKLSPRFSPDYSEVTFSIDRGDDEKIENIKISKGEESCFMWSVFYSLLEQVIEQRNILEISERETDKFNDLQYVFIDDPVSSLDENHLISLAVDIAQLIKSSKSNLKFKITTHNPIFYNVLYSELQKPESFLLCNLEDGEYSLKEKKGDSNNSFSYHLHIKEIIEQAIDEEKIEKFHFTLLRNLYEKTSSFLGYPRWKELLPDDQQTYYNRIIQFTSHSNLSNETVSEPTRPEKQIITFLLKHLKEEFNFWEEKKINT